MESFLSKTVEWNKFELLIDTKIFSKVIILKSAYKNEHWYCYGPQKQSDEARWAVLPISTDVCLLALAAATTGDATSIKEIRCTIERGYLSM